MNGDYHCATANTSYFLAGTLTQGIKLDPDAKHTGSKADMDYIILMAPRKRNARFGLGAERDEPFLWQLPNFESRTNK